MKNVSFSLISPFSTFYERLFCVELNIEVNVKGHEKSFAFYSKGQTDSHS